MAIHDRVLLAVSVWKRTILRGERHSTDGRCERGASRVHRAADCRSVAMAIPRRRIYGNDAAVWHQDVLDYA
jgi:hypothetical protein